MRDRRERVHGPYKKRRRWRVVVVGAGSEGDRHTHSFATEGDARAFIATVEKNIQARTVGSAVADYLAAQQRRIDEHEVKACTVERIDYHLHQILKLTDHAGLDLRKATPAWGAKLYNARRGAVDTHRNGLSVAKAWGAWCVEQGWIKVNPFGAVKGKGRRRRGKPQLRLEESRDFSLKCLELAPTDAGAVLALAYLLLGTRAGEVLNRQVRDLDDGGRLLWIPDTKTPAGRRQLAVPDVLVPHIARLAKGRPGLAPLFEHASTRKRPADWAREQVTRLCKLAGVPRVTPHGLRGTHATIGSEAGAVSSLVASALGHASPAITEAAYIDSGRQRSAKAKATLRAIAGGLS